MREALSNIDSQQIQRHIFTLRTDSEVDSLVSQSVIPSKKQLGGAKPFAFTKQGVATLSSVLTSDRTIEINIHIMRTFVQMRRFIAQNAALFQRLESVEQKQMLTDSKLDQVFEALEAGEIKPKQGIFFEGQIFDAFGASLKDLGKKWFDFSRFDKGAVEALGREGK